MNYSIKDFEIMAPVGSRESLAQVFMREQIPSILALRV